MSSWGQWKNLVQYHTGDLAKSVKAQIDTWWNREPIVDISSTLFYKNIEGQYLKNKEDQFQSKDSWRQVEFKNIV